MSTNIIGKHSFDDTPDVNGQLFLLNGNTTDYILSDIIDNRPSPGYINRLFVDNTNNTIYRDTGSEWVELLQHINVVYKELTVSVVTPANGETNVINNSLVLNNSNIFRVNIGGIITSNVSNTPIVRVRIYFGSSLLYDDNSIVIPVGTLTSFNAMLMISPEGLNIQHISGIIYIGINGGATTGSGDLGTDEIRALTPIYGSSTQANNVPQAFRVTITLTNATNANVTLYQKIIHQL